MADSENGVRTASDRYVMLTGGLILPVSAIELALELEERSFRLSREDDSTLVVRPCERLTREDCRRIRRWKWHLLALLDYGQSGFVQ
jgi:hypothetical protein